MRAHWTGDAGDAIKGRTPVAAFHTATDCVPVRPESIGERAADDCTRAPQRRLAPVGGSTTHGDAERLEIAGGHLHHLHAIAAFARWAGDVDDGARAQLRAFERECAAETDRFHTGQRAYARRQLFEEVAGERRGAIRSEER